MNTKFILDSNFKTNNLDEIKKILDVLKEKPLKYDLRARFLKNFTLSIFDVMKKGYSPEFRKLELGNSLKNYQKINLETLQIPKKIEFPFDLFLTAPTKFDLPKELLKETPSKDLVVNAPYKESFEENI